MIYYAVMLPTSCTEYLLQQKANYQKIESDSKIKDKRFCAALVWMKPMDEDNSEGEMMDDKGV